MPFFLQMSQDQSLPVPIQHILTAGRCELQSAAPFTGFQQQVHFRIMSQGFKMSDAFHRFRQRLLIDNASRIEFRFQSETLPQDIFQDLHLHLPHDLHMDLPLFLLP